MKLIDFLKYIIRNLDLDYESEYFMYGYLDGLRFCDNSVTVEDFGNPFYIKLFELLIKSGRLTPVSSNDILGYKDNFSHHKTPKVVKHLHVV